MATVYGPEFGLTFKILSVGLVYGDGTRGPCSSETKS